MKIKALFTTMILSFLIMVGACHGQAGFLISGKVTNLDGGRLSVSIRHKGGMAVSDNEGNFRIKLNALSDTIWFNAIGYERIYRVISDPSEFLMVRMVQSTKLLSEVLIQTGYQAVKPNEINGTVSVVDEKMLNQRSGASILERLVGQTSGLLLNVGKSNGNPQNKTNISVRGLGTINGPLDPLIVLDGFIYEGDYENINPNDVADVSILKDAAAASIWGARAGNGVIVITTKRGRINQPMQIAFNANVIANELPDIGRVSRMANGDYLAVEQQLFDAGYFNDRIKNTPYIALTPGVEIMLAKREGKIDQATAMQQFAILANGDTRKAMLDRFYAHAILQQYSFSVKGGGTKNSYLLAAAYEHNNGENYGNNEKLNLHFANDFNILKGLVVSTNLYYTQTSAKSGRPNFSQRTVGGRYPSYLSFEDGNTQALQYRATYTDTVANGKFLDWKYDPSNDYKYSFNERNSEEWYGNVAAKYQILEGLGLQLSYQYQRQKLDNKDVSTIESYAARHLVNTYSQYNTTTGVVKYVVPLGGILDQGYSQVNSQTARAQLNFNKLFGKHALNAILGAESRGANAVGNAVRRLGYIADPLYFGNVDTFNAYPEYLTGNYTEIGDGSSLQSTHQRFASFYANTTYSYSGKYSLSASVRRDGSNIFGANTNDKWKPLWSVGLGWKIANEEFYNLRWLPVLRISANYGKSGNVDISRTALPIVSYSTQSVTRLPYTRIRSINNPDLKWEELAQFNVKLDFEMHSQRLVGAISYYPKYGSDLYGNTVYDYTKWGERSELVLNVADMTGYGFDVDLHSRVVERNEFSWISDFYFSQNISKTKKYYSVTGNSIYGLLGGGSVISPVEDRPLYSIASYKWGGLDPKGNPQGYLNGQLSIDYNAMAAEALTSGENLTYIGNANPTVFGSFINTFKWRQLSLAVNLSYKLGYFVRKPAISYDALINNGLGHKDFEKRWKQSGDENVTDIPSFVYPNVTGRDSFYYGAAINAMPGDHVRLDYLRLGYTFATAQWKMPFRNLELFGGAQNLGILWRANNFGYDPDYATLAPPTRQLTFGLRGSF